MNVTRKWAYLHTKTKTQHDRKNDLQVRVCSLYPVNYATVFSFVLQEEMSSDHMDVVSSPSSPECVFCFQLLEKLNERNLIDGKAEFNPILPGLFWSFSARGGVFVILLSDIQST